MVPSRKQYESMVPQSPVSKGPEAAALWRFRFLHHPVGLPLHNFNWRWFLARFSKTVWGTMVVIRNTRPQAHLNILQYLRMCIYIYICMYVCIYIYMWFLRRFKGIGKLFFFTGQGGARRLHGFLLHWLGGLCLSILGSCSGTGSFRKLGVP